MLLKTVDAGYTPDNFLALKEAGLTKASDFGKVMISDGEYGYAMSAREQDSVKKQLREHRAELDNMKPVATVNDDGWRGISTMDFRKKIVNDLRHTGYQVDNPDIGIIEFAEKELNCERANMAVVVKRTKGNRYKVHRVLTPSGENFVLPEKQMQNLPPPVVSPRFASASGGTAQAINSASADNITQNNTESNTDFSEGAQRFSVDIEAPAEYNTLIEREDVLPGDTDETYTEGDRAVEFEYAIVPAEALIVSNDQYGVSFFRRKK